MLELYRQGFSKLEMGELLGLPEKAVNETLDDFYNEISRNSRSINQLPRGEKYRNEDEEFKFSIDKSVKDEGQRSLDDDFEFEDQKSSSENDQSEYYVEEEAVIIDLILYYIEKEGRSIEYIASVLGIDRNFLFYLKKRKKLIGRIRSNKSSDQKVRNRKDQLKSKRESISRKDINKISQEFQTKSFIEFKEENSQQQIHMGPFKIHESQSNNLRTTTVLRKMFKGLMGREPNEKEHRQLGEIDLKDINSWSQIKVFGKVFKSEKEFRKWFGYFYCYDIFRDLEIVFPNLDLDQGTLIQFNRYIGKMEEGEFKAGELASVIEYHKGKNWDLETGQSVRSLIFYSEIETIIRAVKKLIEVVEIEFEIKIDALGAGIQVAWQKGDTGERRFEGSSNDNAGSGPDGLIVVDFKRLLGKKFDIEKHERFEFVFLEGKTQSTFHEQRQIVYIKKSPGNKSYVGSDMLLKASSGASLFDSLYRRYYFDDRKKKDFELLLESYYSRISQDVNLAKLEFLSQKIQKPFNQIELIFDGTRWKNKNGDYYQKDMDKIFGVRDNPNDSEVDHRFSFYPISFFGDRQVDEVIFKIIQKDLKDTAVEINQINVEIKVPICSGDKSKENSNNGNIKFLLVRGEISEELLSELTEKTNAIVFRITDGDIISQFSKLVNPSFKPNKKHFSKSFNIPVHFDNGSIHYLNIRRGYHQSIPWSDFVNYVFQSRSTLKNIEFPNTIVGGMTFRKELKLKSSYGSQSKYTGTLVLEEMNSLDMCASYVGKHIDKPHKKIPKPKARMEIKPPCEFEERGEIKCDEGVKRGLSPNEVVLGKNERPDNFTSNLLINLKHDENWNKLPEKQKEIDIKQFRGYFQKVRAEQVRRFNSALNISEGGKQDGKSGVAKWWCYGCGVKRVDGLIYQFAFRLQKRGVSKEFLEVWKRQYFWRYI